MSFGISEFGFNRKTFDDLIQEAENRAKNLYGTNIQLSENSFFGLLLQCYIFFQDTLWQELENTYNAAYIDTATGIQLDNIVKYTNIQRKQAVKATGEVTFTGTNGTVIPIGTLVSTGEIQFETTVEGTITGGSVTVGIIASELGESSNVNANTITTIVNPIAGVTSVDNALATTGGQDEETDEELRDRYYNTLATGGKSTLDAIRADVLQVSGVRICTIVENTEDIVVGGLPPHSFECIVDGGDDNDVAQAILDSKPAGIDTHGDITENVQDDSGTTREIKFSRPVQVDIWVNITITTDDDYPADGDIQVRNNIVTFINDLDVGDDVIINQLIHVVYDVVGIVDITTLELSDDGVTFSATNITIGNDEKAQTDATKVVVTSA